MNAATAAKALRFGAVGVASGLIFAAATSLAVRGGVAPVPASVVGYCASVPMSFLGHRRFSFRSHGRWTGEALRFVATQAFNIALTAAAMQAAVALLGGAYQWGMAAAVVLVPVANFVVLNLWVFRAQGDGRRAAGGIGS